MFQIIVALLLMQNTNSFDFKHQQTFSNVDKVIKIVRIVNGFNGR